jgi:hypothetical protein
MLGVVTALFLIVLNSGRVGAVAYMTVLPTAMRMKTG